LNQVRPHASHFHLVSKGLFVLPTICCPVVFVFDTFSLLHFGHFIELVLLIFPSLLRPRFVGSVVVAGVAPQVLNTGYHIEAFVRGWIPINRLPRDWAMKLPGHGAPVPIKTDGGPDEEERANQPGGESAFHDTTEEFHVALLLLSLYRAIVGPPIYIQVAHRRNDCMSAVSGI
jgi:hypothetical protein